MIAKIYLASLTQQLKRYKHIGDITLNRLSVSELFWFTEHNNSIAIIAKHMAGNMLSRWTNFKTEDGEKPWRNRDQEFINKFNTKEEVIAYWEEGWQCLFNALKNTTEEELLETIYIRKEPHTLIEAFNRQLAHYSYHVGQMVYIAKLIKAEQWQSLSIPKGESDNYLTSPPKH